MSNDNHIREAVIKLETKMEVMSESMSSMANSVAKLADMRYEIVSLKKDVLANRERADRIEDTVKQLSEEHKRIEKAQTKNSYVVGKIEIFWGALVTGAAGFLWWLAR